MIIIFIYKLQSRWYNQIKVSVKKYRVVNLVDYKVKTIDKRPSCHCSYGKRDYLKWLLDLLGPIILGAKPSEIISFPRRDTDRDEKIDFIESFFSFDKNIEVKKVEYGHKCTKLFVYNRKSLENTLSDKRIVKFLSKHGYPNHYDMDLYVSALMEKIQSMCIPDEIGVFLGYPLKDVIGFIGHPSLRLCKVQGWRVYGDPKLSDRKYKEIMEARRIAKHILKNDHNYHIEKIAN